jgi:hypothetical protein
MDLGLQGRTALITGGSKGIGKAIALVLAEEGAAHLHLCSRTREELEATAGEIRAAHGTQVTIHPLDLSNSSNVAMLAQACQDVDFLVNNAGAIPGGSIAEVDERKWRDAWDLKVFGYINMCREFYPIMTGRGHGVILNIIGSGGQVPDPNYIAGVMGNRTLMMLSQALGARSVEHGVRVLAINPGLIATDRMLSLLQAKAELLLGDGKRWEELLTIQPMNRAGTVDEVAPMAAFLLSRHAAYISGTVVTIDAGHSQRVDLF